MIHRPRNTGNIGEPALNMPGLNIPNHNCAFISGHLQRGCAQHPVPAQRPRNVGTVGQRHGHTRTTQKVDVFTQEVQTTGGGPYPIGLFTIGLSKRLAYPLNFILMFGQRNPLRGCGGRHRTPFRQCDKTVLFNIPSARLRTGDTTAQRQQPRLMHMHLYAGIIWRA